MIAGQKSLTTARVPTENPPSAFVLDRPLFSKWESDNSRDEEEDEGRGREENGFEPVTVRTSPLVQVGLKGFEAGQLNG